MFSNQKQFKSEVLILVEYMKLSISSCVELTRRVIMCAVTLKRKGDGLYLLAKRTTRAALSSGRHCHSAQLVFCSRRRPCTLNN